MPGAGDTFLFLYLLLIVHSIIRPQVNGCSENDGFYTELECDTAFYHGIVSHGLLGAFTEYINLARRVIRSRIEEMSAAASGGTPCEETTDRPYLREIQRFGEDFLYVGLRRGE